MNHRGQGSLTVEASLLLPIILFTMIMLMYLTKLLVCQDQVQNALNRLARESSIEATMTEQKSVALKLWCQGKMSQYIPGSKGKISFYQTELQENGVIDLVASYYVSLPIKIPYWKGFLVIQRTRTRGFIGVISRGGEDDGNRYVYITKTGTVYHKNMDCTYLSLSISTILFQDIKDVHNESGGIYYACHSCCKNKNFKATDRVYIANYGDRFHCQRTCNKITRTIQKVKLKDVGNRLPCSKCGGD